MGKDLVFFASMAIICLDLTRIVDSDVHAK